MWKAVLQSKKKRKTGPPVLRWMKNVKLAWSSHFHTLWQKGMLYRNNMCVMCLLPGNGRKTSFTFYVLRTVRSSLSEWRLTMILPRARYFFNFELGSFSCRIIVICNAPLHPYSTLCDSFSRTRQHLQCWKLDVHHGQRNKHCTPISSLQLRH